MNIFLFIFLFFLKIIVKENSLILFISIFSLSITIIFSLYYLYTIIWLKINKRKIEKNFKIPTVITHSNLKFKNIFNPLFFSIIKLLIITDKQKIEIKYNSNEDKFISYPFYFGKHCIKYFYLYLTDPFKFLTIKFRLKNYPEILYNTFKIGQKKDLKPFNIKSLKHIKTNKKIKDESLLLRDYIPGDDVRKILWRSLAISDNLKFKEDYFERSNINIISINFKGIKSIKYYFITSYILYKIYYLINSLLELKIPLKINNQFLNQMNKLEIQKFIFDYIDDETINDVSIETNCITIFSIFLKEDEIEQLNKTPHIFLKIDKQFYFNDKTLKDLKLKNEKYAKKFKITI